MVSAELQTAYLDVAHVLDAAVTAVRPIFDERQHRLRLQYGPYLMVEADPVRLEQIIINLLTNAAKFTQAHGEICLAARRLQGDVVISVQDNGIGIAPEISATIFDLFAQSDLSPARSEGGLGIGLTLVKILTEMHGGTVSVESHGHWTGSTFTVTLPAAKIPPPCSAGGN
jgi:signal transduction histidine kinase